MLKDQDPNIKIDVLVNSLGPHEQVRVREPFCGLQRLGVDCKLNRYPFRLRKNIRPKSLVVWQRPRPESWQQQLDILRWIRAQGSILLTEWDDHPDLFPINVQADLKRMDMAPIRLCHGLHTSSEVLAGALCNLQPRSIVIPNAIWRIPALNDGKHREAKQIRIFIGNQNRADEHSQLTKPLIDWCASEPKLKIVIVGDSHLAAQLPQNHVERYPLLPYLSFRKVLRSCHIALMPLNDNLANRCKTPIKWMESAAESVAVVASHCLYNQSIKHGNTGMLAANPTSMVQMSQWLAYNRKELIEIVRRAHHDVAVNHSLRLQLEQRLAIYKQTWAHRAELDGELLKRHPAAITESPFELS